MRRRVAPITLFESSKLVQGLPGNPGKDRERERGKNISMHSSFGEPMTHTGSTGDRRFGSFGQLGFIPASHRCRLNGPCWSRLGRFKIASSLDSYPHHRHHPILLLQLHLHLLIIITITTAIITLLNPGLKHKKLMAMITVMRRKITIVLFRDDHDNRTSWNIIINIYPDAR